MTGPVITATYTVMSGLVVRWYRTLSAAQYGNSPVLSASREGVMIHGDVFLHELPGEWVKAATQAHEAIKAGRPGEAEGLATHRTKGFMGDLVPIEALREENGVRQPGAPVATSRAAMWTGAA